MLRFDSDYTEGAHPRVLQWLQKTNLEQTNTYGEDEYCARAAALIRDLCRRPDAAVHFLVGGTQVNFTVISAALRPHEGVLAAETGHISLHESGAVEATGHKVLALPEKDGKITAAQVAAAYDGHIADSTHEHMVRPGMVYISYPTECGTLYSREELSALYKACKSRGLPLYIDGARMGYGLMSPAADMDLATLAGLCDAFTIGGTKAGALLGEALVITHEGIKRDFRYIEKQKGAMLAKGRLLGLQYVALLEDGLYFTLARRADELAFTIRDACREKGFPLWVDSPTNQQFPILPAEALAKLEEKYVFARWQRLADGRLAVRMCTSWATGEDAAAQLVNDIRAL